MSDSYPVFEITPEWVLEPEGMGSKEKFWYREREGAPDWLFKFPQPNTGQHWAEKIAAEVADCLGIRHARVELAVFQGTRGSSSESFAGDRRDLYHGNQILAGQVLDYQPAKRFKQSDHTLENIFTALERSFSTKEGAQRAKRDMVDYLVLDAVIGNTDRHHENWGILRRRVGDRWQGVLAPSFDHASSLGRELADTSDGKCRIRFLGEGRVGVYAEKAPGAIYWSREDRKGLSPLALVRRATEKHPDLFRLALGRLERLSRPRLQEIVTQIPTDWISPVAQEFAVELMCYTLNELRHVQP